MTTTDPAPQTTPQRVVVVDLDIPFGQMIWLLLKLSLAAIPAAAILAIFLVLLGSVLGGLQEFGLS